MRRVDGATMCRGVVHQLFCGAVALTIVCTSTGADAQGAERKQQDAYAYSLPFDRGAAGLAQTLRKLHTRASLIQINAHPDDEDGGMLTFEGRSEGADVSLLSLNRGEGGQNVMTADYWDALGILRTQEHLAANRYYGDHLYYTRVADFGFSKTPEETLAQWGHDRVLADVVRVVRTVRPMVVTSVFAGNVSDGHGHHQTSGMMAQEVFQAAADPKMFPEQIQEGLRPWAPLKVYARVPFARVSERGIFDYATGRWEAIAYKNYVTGEVMHSVPQPTVTVPEGDYNALFGESFFQIARQGLNEQKSQMGGVGVPPAGRANSSYHLYASRVNGGTIPSQEKGFFDGIDTSLPGIASYLKGKEAEADRAKLQAIASRVDEAIRLFDGNDPSKCAPALAEGLSGIRSLILALQLKPEADGHYDALHELRLKEEQFELALNQSLGVTLLAVLQPGHVSPRRVGPMGPIDAASVAAGSPEATSTVVPGEAFAVNVHVAAQAEVPLAVNALRLVANTEGDWKVSEQSEVPKMLRPGEGNDVLLSAAVPQNAPLTKPYFSRPSLKQDYYDIHDFQYLTLPTMPYPLSAEISYTFAGIPVHLRGVVQTATREEGHGVVLNPLLVAPAISVRLSPDAGIMPLSAKTLPLDVTVHSSVKGPAEGELALKLPAGWTATPAKANFKMTRDNEEAKLHFDVDPRGVQPKGYSITAVATYAGKQYREGFAMIGYPGLRPYPQYASARYRTAGVDVKIAPGLRVAYVMGSGDNVPQSLENLGVHPTLLSASDIAGGDLSQYDAIVLGIRTYAVRPELRTFRGRLLNYVRNGGVVICQYQTGQYGGEDSPFPLNVSGDAEKVVEEDAKVDILKPEDPALTWPNKVDTQDFENWVEERGHGFAGSFDPHYVALTQTQDMGQDPQTGGLVYAQYGKGYYVYLAYAFFRQMPEGVSGSYRIMANLLSLGKNPGLKHATEKIQ